ncbi:uncharacterized protein ARB_06858 [Trichophyton benhamiae CBS 112371]|uniref:Uncharacterized protein n=1 Tax=Arthroderma benhamiae (strain ATCC MYA-4681 / CBS 112371) TaxID=663331 RepID=D4AR29_ARTBC|nr:uncharacterized protein ARB_06858 [Trichophyton benhamiae CBS 112371]EFE34458.1 hypothetical protein ARB_06858 [Trichophyton benhamiae CBS 112371]
MFENNSKPLSSSSPTSALSPGTCARVKISSKMPFIPSSTDVCNGYMRPSIIDLSRTENFLLRDELADIVKTAKTHDSQVYLLCIYIFDGCISALNFVVANIEIASFFLTR